MVRVVITKDLCSDLLPQFFTHVHSRLIRLELYNKCRLYLRILDTTLTLGLEVGILHFLP